MDNKVVVQPYVESVHVRYYPGVYDPDECSDIDFHNAVGAVVKELRAHMSDGAKSFSSVNDNGHAIDIVFAWEVPMRVSINWTNRINEMIKAEVARAASQELLASHLG